MGFSHPHENIDGWWFGEWKLEKTRIWNYTILSDSYLHGGIIGCCKQIISTGMECYFVDSTIMVAVILQQFVHTDVIHFHDIVCHCCSNTCSTGMKFYIHCISCRLKVWNNDIKYLAILSSLAFLIWMLFC